MTHTGAGAARRRTTAFDTARTAAPPLATNCVLPVFLAELDLQSLGMLPMASLAGFLTLLNGGYVVVLIVVGGQTFGKMAFGVRVVDRGGCSVTTAVAVVRVLGYLVSVLPLGLGVVSMFLDSERCALHDRLAGTRVLAGLSTSGH